MKRSNSSKVKYWNSLRVDLNKLLLLLFIVGLIICFFLPDQASLEDEFPSKVVFNSILEGYTVFVFWIIEFLTYLVVVNILLLAVELVDRSFRIHSNEKFKKVFRILSLIGFPLFGIMNLYFFVLQYT